MILVRVREEQVYGGTTGQTWADSVNEYLGCWVEVEQEYLFQDQFNIREPSVRLSVKYITAIAFIDQSYAQFREAVRERYAKSWPGSEVSFKALETVEIEEQITLADGRRVDVTKLSEAFWSTQA